VGQRRGLGVAAGERRYVVDVDVRSATVTIGARHELLRDQVELRELVLTPGIHSAVPLLAQTRAHGEPLAATLDGTTVRFSRPQPRVAPGQVVALYDGDVLVGGGIAD
jgi:tRNA-specific 2-thiouridylase